jgi:hypothetical protein
VRRARRNEARFHDANDGLSAGRSQFKLQRWSHRFCKLRDLFVIDNEHGRLREAQQLLDNELPSVFAHVDARGAKWRCRIMCAMQQAAFGSGPDADGWLKMRMTRNIVRSEQTISAAVFPKIR